MTATDAPAPALDTAAAGAGTLPPYSADQAICPKCLHTEAFTWYRQPLTRCTTVPDWNGATARRGPLPERHERECGRCTYRWDEALPVDRPGMTVDALVYALGHALPYPAELDPPVLERMACKLLNVLNVSARPDHPLWQYSDGRPPAGICEVPHATREEEDACEARRTSRPHDTQENSR
ncbi:hypothetical protein ABZ499_33040 [Streptomyces sp. NPDC019990]|uniref:hypothetical protein n=1 Tax=Streptomyces sp. NPDC019990 TaxID=3154693 RepID=UPI0033F3E447